MGSADQVEVVAAKELGHDVFPEGETNASVILSPADDILIGIRPEQVTQEPRVGHISGAHNAFDLLHLRELWAEPTVHAEDLFVDDSRHREAVEAVDEGLPQLNVIPSLALIVEAVDTVDGRTLVIATKDEKVLRVPEIAKIINAIIALRTQKNRKTEVIEVDVLDFVRQEKADGLHALLPAVHVVPEEEVVRLWRETTIPVVGGGCGSR